MTVTYEKCAPGVLHFKSGLSDGSITKSGQAWFVRFWNNERKLESNMYGWSQKEAKQKLEDYVGNKK